MGQEPIAKRPNGCLALLVPDLLFPRRAIQAAMAEEDPDNGIEPTTEELTSVPQTVGSFLISVAFWSTLFVSALMYAAVSLSPKLADWISVRKQHAANVMRLQELDDEADYLERVAAALKSDPEFARRLVHATQSGSTPHEFVPVSDSLIFGGTNAKSTVARPLVQPAVADVVMHLARHQQHRRWLLFGAAGLTLLAFTLLNESGSGIIQAAFSSMIGFSQAALSRYRQDPSVASDDETEMDAF